MTSSRAILTLAVLLAVGTVALADTPKLINFQGRLTTPGGVPVPDAIYIVTFKIYDAPTGGTNLWSETNSVATSSGLFTVLLGNNVALAGAVFADTVRYVGIQVNMDPELAPRQKLVSVPYSYRVSTVDSASGGTIKSKVSIGPGHVNTGTDAFVAGSNNRARGNYSAVGGGGGAAASDSNSAIGDNSTIGGGQSNTASGPYSTVGGGYVNKAGNFYVTVGGGRQNTATLDGATISGGYLNNASAQDATVGGGHENTASSGGATVGGGFKNTASNAEATVGGGINNMASGARATVAGGAGNTANQSYATVAGGNTNVASGQYSEVAGGNFNDASGQYSSVSGGLRNSAGGSGSMAAGSKAKALHDGTFVWSDGNDSTDFGSTNIDQFLIHADSGVGIGTNNPTEALHVEGNLRIGGITPLGMSSEVNAILNVDANFRLKADDALRGGAFRLDTRNPVGLTQLFTWWSRSPGSGTENLRMVLTEGGSLGIGVIPSFPIDLASGAHVTVGGVWTNASSRELKTDIQPLKNEEYADILDKLERLEVVHFKYKAEPEVAHIGMIAEDVPDEMASPDRKGIPTADAIAFLMAAVKAQQSVIEEQSTKIDRLENTLAQLGKHK